MTVYGVTPAGFVLKPVTELQAEMKADVLGTIDPGLDVADDQPVGQLLGIMAEKLGEVWELAQVAFNATNRGDAEGALLANIGGLTGTPPLPQTTCKVPCNAQFSAAGFYAAGTLAAFISGAPGQQWTNLIGLTVPATGDDGNPIGVGHLYTARSAIWQSSTDGPIYGNALDAAITLHGSGQLNQKVPVAGWFGIADAGGVTLGTLQETDPAYRLRQYQELSAPGACTLDAIQAAILTAIAPLFPQASVQMLENTTLTTSAQGLPPKSFMAVVYDGPGAVPATNDPIISAAILANKPAGIQAFGLYTPATILDPVTGAAVVVPFTRPVGVPIYMAMTVAVAPGTTATQQNAIAAAIGVALVAASQGSPFTLYGTTVTPGAGAQTAFAPGADVILSAQKAIVQGQAGVLDVPAMTLGMFFPATSGVNLSFSLAQIATLAAGNDGGGHAFLTITFITFTP